MTRESACYSFDGEVSESVRRKWHLLSTEGRQERGDIALLDHNQLPEWFDSGKLRTSQRIVCENAIGVGWAALDGLPLLVQLHQILLPVLYTRKSESIACLFDRYFKQVHQGLRWMKDDFSSPQGRGFTSLAAVRKMHTNAADRLNSSFPRKQGQLWLSQYDMVIAQFATFALFIIAPDKYGVHGSERQKVVTQATIDLWRVIARGLGVKDEYNLCTGTYEETIQLCHVIFKEVYLPLLHGEGSHMGRQMSRDMVKAFEPIMIIKHSYDPMLLSLCETFNVPQEHRPRLTRLSDTIVYWLLKYFFLLCNSSLLTYLSSFAWRVFSALEKKRLQYRRELLIKYPVISYTLSAYLSNEHNNHLDISHESEAQLD